MGQLYGLPQTTGIANAIIRPAEPLKLHMFCYGWFTLVLQPGHYQLIT